MDYNIQAPFAALSSASCLIIICISATKKKLYLTHPYQFVFVLAILDFFWSTVCLIPYPKIKTNSFCQFQGFMNQFFNIAQILWTGFISLETYSVAYRRRIKLLYGFYRPLLLILFISGILASIPLGLNAYGEVHGWCWIGNQDDDKKYKDLFLRIFCFTIIMISVFFWNSYVNFLVYYKLRPIFAETNFREIRRLRVYPIIMLICYFPIIICAFVIDDSVYYEGIITTANCIFISEGFLNCLAYACTSNFWRAVRKDSYIDNDRRISGMSLRSEFI